MNGPQIFWLGYVSGAVAVTLIIALLKLLGG